MSPENRPCQPPCHSHMSQDGTLRAATCPQGQTLPQPTEFPAQGFCAVIFTPLFPIPRAPPPHPSPAWSFTKAAPSILARVLLQLNIYSRNLFLGKLFLGASCCECCSSNAQAAALGEQS